MNLKMEPIQLPWDKRANKALARIQDESLPKLKTITGIEVDDEPTDGGVEGSLGTRCHEVS